MWQLPEMLVFALIATALIYFLQFIDYEDDGKTKRRRVRERITDAGPAGPRSVGGNGLAAGDRQDRYGPNWFESRSGGPVAKNASPSRVCRMRKRQVDRRQAADPDRSEYRLEKSLNSCAQEFKPSRNQ